MVDPRLAASAAMSTRSFQRHFSSTTGMPAGEWLLKERLSCAKRLLEETDLSVDDIAEKVGFGAAATLREHFRTKFSMSPAVYRQRFKSK